VQSITTHPSPASRASAAPQTPGFFSSPLFFRIHLALTAVLMVALLALGVLAAAGQLHFGKLTPADAATAEDPAAPKAEEKEKPKEGRYQIEMVDDSRAAVALSLTGLDVAAREVWVFRYKGGFVQCQLSSDSAPPEEKPGAPVNVPPHWKMLRGDKSLQTGKPEHVNREGYLVLIGTSSRIEDDVIAVQPTLGSVFAAAGPGGPLSSLVPYSREVWRRCGYLLFVSARPLPGREGLGFDYPHVPSAHLLEVHSPFVDYDPPYYAEPTRIEAGKDLEAGKEITILERKRGYSTIRLQARFLTDEEVAEKAE